MIKEELILNKAATFAAIAHAGQFRKDGHTPYIIHPLRVGMLVRDFGGLWFEVIIAYWHDILEDCPNYCATDIIEELHSYEIDDDRIIGIICNSLYALDKNKVSGKNRNEKHKNYYENIRKAGMHSVFVKFCDRIDNVIDSDGMGDFAKTYVVKETKELIDELSWYPFQRNNDAIKMLKEERLRVTKKNNWSEE